MDVHLHQKKKKKDKIPQMDVNCFKDRTSSIKGCKSFLSPEKDKEHAPTKIFLSPKKDEEHVPTKSFPLSLKKDEEHVPTKKNFSKS